MRRRDMLKGAAAFIGSAGLLALPKLAKAKLDSDSELAFGVDNNTGDVVEVDLQTGMDASNNTKQGYYAWAEHGFANLNMPAPLVTHWPIVARGWTPFSFYRYDENEGEDREDCHFINLHGDKTLTCPVTHYGTSLNWKPDSDDVDGAQISAMGIESIQNKLYGEQWQVILSSGCDRNIVVYDSENDEQGRMSNRLVSLMKTVMQRNGSGRNNNRMTNLVIGTKVFEDTFDVEPFTSVTLFGVTIHHTPELNKGSEFHWYYTDMLHGTFPDKKTCHCPNMDDNLAIGIDARYANFQSWVPKGHVLTERRWPPYVACKEHGIKADEYNSSRVTMRCGHVILDERGVLLGAF